MSLVSSPVCSFCDNNDESLRHLFVHCSFVSVFWDQIPKLEPKSVGIILIILTIILYYLVFHQLEKRMEVTLFLNTIILVGKLIEPSFALFLAKINHVKSLEYQVAKKKGKISHFFRQVEKFAIIIINIRSSFA